MQQIIEQVGPSRQLFEIVNFAFMKFFDFLVKIAIFEAFLVSFGRFALCITDPFEHLIWKVTYDGNLPKIGEMPQK